MKVAIAAEEGRVNTYVDSRLGRAAYFLIGELGTPITTWQIRPNEAGASGAGVGTAQFLVDAKANAVVAGNIGPNAAKVLNAAGIRMFLAERAALAKGELSQVNTPSVQVHSGLAQASEPAVNILLAVATDGTMVAQHFGHCPIYTLVRIQNGEEVARRAVKNPGHTPGFLPKFLAEKGVDCVVAGGMGQKAIDLFNEQGVDTIVGVTGSVDEVIAMYAAGQLKGGESACDHNHS
jgi:predicted Fe-Mo cluster-binding NifX family protein